jgi:uncharacterized protein (TIGR03382 family)
MGCIDTRSMKHTLVALAMLGLFIGRARADGIQISPLACPNGSIQRDSHLGSFCVPTECDGDDACGRIVAGSIASRGKTLQCVVDRGLCVETRTVDDPRVRMPDGSGGTQEIDVALETCSAGGSCPEGSRCEVARRCVDPSASASTAGCGCDASGTPLAGVLLVGAALVGFRLPRRR